MSTKSISVAEAMLLQKQLQARLNAEASKPIAFAYDPTNARQNVEEFARQAEANLQRTVALFKDLRTLSAAISNSNAMTHAEYEPNGEDIRVPFGDVMLTVAQVLAYRKLIPLQEMLLTKWAANLAAVETTAARENEKRRAEVQKQFSGVTVSEEAVAVINAQIERVTMRVIKPNAYDAITSRLQKEIEDLKRAMDLALQRRNLSTMISIELDND